MSSTSFMRIPFLVLAWFLPCALLAQDVEAKYLKLQESYSQRLQELERTYNAQQRDLLDKFIIALVRTEQTYRDQGDLEGVVMSRELRESLLENPNILRANNEWPQGLRDMFDELIRLRQQNRTTSQNQLDDLNRVLLRALEPYKVEFTRQGNLEKAIEIRDLQEQLSRGLGLDPGRSTPSAANPVTPPPTPSAVQDPNMYAFLLEPRAYRDTQGISVRRAAQEPALTLEDGVEESRMSYRFDGGYMSMPDAQLEAFRGVAGRNQMFTLELAVNPGHVPQGIGGQPAVIFRWGPSVYDANLAVTQEGRRLYLFVKTTAPPENRNNYKIDLGRVDDQTPTHLMVVFRGTDLVIYREGVDTQRLRGAMKGTFANWVPSPLVFSRGSAQRERRAERTGEEAALGRWYGHLYLMSLKGSQETARQLDENHDRFQKMMDR